jgi:Fic family protein
MRTQLDINIIQNKTQNYRLLQEVRTKDKWEDWILYILKGVEKTSLETIEQIKAIQKLFISIQEKIKKEAPKAYDKELIEILFEHPYCKTEILTSRLNISRITATNLKQLEGINVLKSKQVWKETIYINTRLFDLLKKSLSYSKIKIVSKCSIFHTSLKQRTITSTS